MKLSEYLALCENNMEVTVWDDVYDMETYFYPGPIKDDFEKATNLIAQCVDIIEISEDGVTVNFWDVIEKSRKALIDGGFYSEGSSTEYLMQDVDAILAGNLSEAGTLEWAEIIYKTVMAKEDKATAECIDNNISCQDNENQEKVEELCDTCVHGYYNGLSGDGQHNLCGAGMCYLCQQQFGSTCDYYQKGKPPNDAEPMY